MGTDLNERIAHPMGEQPEAEEWSAVADTFAGRVHIEWDTTAPVTPLGQLPFFIEYLKQGGLFDGWVADCPLLFTSPNAPRKRDVLGTLLLSVLAGHRRYAHVTALRCDAVNPPLLGMGKVVSEDALRRALAKIDEGAGMQWLQGHLDYCVRPLLDEPWVLDVDATIKPLYGHQEGAVVGYNPRKPGRPSHCYHTYMLSDLRLVLRVEVHPGDQHNPKHAAAGLWSLLAQLGRERWPRLLRGDAEWGNEGVMARAEQEGLPYLFRLRATANVKRALERAMAERDWGDAGQGWQGKASPSRDRRRCSPHPGAAHPCLAGTERGRAGRHLPAGAPAGPGGAFRFHRHGRSRRQHRRCAAGSPALSLPSGLLRVGACSRRARWGELCGIGGGSTERIVGARPSPIAASQRQSLGRLPQSRRRHTAGSDAALRGTVRTLPHAADPQQSGLGA